MIGLVGGKFLPDAGVTRLQVAYSLVQALGLQSAAVSYTGTLSVSYDGKRIPIEDVASIPVSLRGYVQGALDAGLLNARFTLTQGPYDNAPTIHAFFDPTKGVTRAAYAVAIGRYATQY